MTIHLTRFFPATAAVVLCAFAASAASAQTANRPPTVTGTIPTNAIDHVYYSWRPYAKDPDGDTLRFSVTGLPSWAQFNTSVGRITGTPRAPGRHPNVSITVTDGHYTKTIGPVTIVVAAAPTTPPPTSGSTLSERYPGDVGIAADSAVIFADPFEDSSTSTLANRYQSVYNVAQLAMVADKHAKSRGARSVRMTAGVKSDTAGLFRNLGTGYDEVYLRYYTKYVGTEFDHSGMWFGGYNPALNWGYPRAGQKPTGSDRFSFALEPNPGNLMDLFTYWMHMRSWKANPGSNDYYGNIFINDKDFGIRQNQWTCYEIHVKLNPNPANGLDAVLELWENDQLVRRFDNTGPYGWIQNDKFCPADADSAACAPYRPSNPAQVLLNQQWRNTTALKINHIWPQNYNVTKVDSNLLFDDLVLAKSRVGCVK